MRVFIMRTLHEAYCYHPDYVGFSSNGRDHGPPPEIRGKYRKKERKREIQSDSRSMGLDSAPSNILGYAVKAHKQGVVKRIKIKL